jgi:hypothetical protein
MMQSTEGHQEIPKEEATVMPVGEPAAERRQKRKERTRGNRGYRKKSTAACRKVSRRAKVAWRKRNFVRKIRIQENWEPWKRLTATGRKTTSCATVAWHSENVEGLDQEPGKTRNPETTKRRGQAAEIPGMQQWHKGPRPKTEAT